ncbi:hypothetical protein D3C84_631690 [compost metagenome]
MIIVVVVTADDIAEADQAVFAVVVVDQPALQGRIERCRLDLRGGEFPVQGIATVNAFDMQVIVFIEGEFEGMQPIDFHHPAVFEGV